MTTSAAAPAAAPTSPAAKSPNTMAAEAIASATQRLAARRGRSTDPSNDEKENNGGAGQFPNGTGSEWDGGAAPGAGGAAAGIAGTVSGSKRDRAEDADGDAETGGGGGCNLLAVASGSADSVTSTNNNTGSGKSNGPSGGTQVRGGGTDSSGGNVLLGLAMASPNTLEGGIRGGIGSIGTGTAGGAFANTVKRRRRGGETTTDGNIRGSNNIRLFPFDEEEDGVADEAAVEGDLGGLDGAVVGKASDAEDRLAQIWKELQQHGGGGGGGGIVGGDPSEHDPECDGDDASTTLLASPSTVHTAGTFDTAATDHTTGTATSTTTTTTTHQLYADLTTAALSQTESLLLAEMGGLIARGVQAHHDRDAAVRELDLRKELADGRGREVRRLQESERQSRETISNLLRAVESAKSDARAASRRIQAETRLRSECTTLRTERDAAAAEAAEAQRRATLAEDEGRAARTQLQRCVQDRARMERDSRAALSLARSLDAHSGSDAAYYKRQMAGLSEQLHQLQATVAEQNLTIAELRRQRERSMSQNQLSQLRAGGGGGGGGKKARKK